MAYTCRVNTKCNSSWVSCSAQDHPHKSITCFISIAWLHLLHWAFPKTDMIWEVSTFLATYYSPLSLSLSLSLSPSHRCFIVYYQPFIKCGIIMSSFMSSEIKWRQIYNSFISHNCYSVCESVSYSCSNRTSLPDENNASRYMVFSNQRRSNQRV